MNVQIRTVDGFTTLYARATDAEQATSFFPVGKTKLVLKAKDRATAEKVAKSNGWAVVSKWPA